MAVNCYIWDFTLKHTDEIEHTHIITDLTSFCKKYSFRLEMSDSGYKHWQGRVSLIKKKRLDALIKLTATLSSLAGIHWSVTSTAGSTSFQYVTKSDTRLDGPWSDTDEPIEPDTKQMTLFKSWELRPWQQSLINTTSNFCLRTIDLVYDESGNAGKSLFSEYLEKVLGVAEEVPPYRMMDHIFEWVATRPIRKIYIIDMPRGMKKDKLADFYSGIEVIKNGVAYDKRYTAKKIRFDRPRIIVFTNMMPNLDLMSKDRWALWEIKNNELIPYE